MRRVVLAAAVALSACATAGRPSVDADAVTGATVAAEKATGPWWLDINGFCYYGYPGRLDYSVAVPCANVVDYSVPGGNPLLCAPICSTNGGVCRVRGGCD